MSHQSNPQWPTTPSRISASGQLKTPTLAPTLPPKRSRGFARKLMLVVLVLALIGAVTSGIGYFLLGRETTSFPGAYFNRGQNAIWLEHSWSGQPHNAADYDGLAATLQAHQIGFVYAHVGPLSSDGTIDPRLAPFAKQLAFALHHRMPGLRILAWIGQLEAASGQPASGTVDLSSSSVRQQIALASRHFVADFGFDGVHYDIEPITNNNAHFLDLLDVTHSELPTGAILSISAEKWAPSARIAQMLFDQKQASSWWTTYYYQQVAAHTDQIVLLPYNSAMPNADLYRIFVKQQVQHVLEAARAAKNSPSVLVGIPTYPGNDKWFHDSAENMDSGLRGVISGLNSEDASSPFVGVAIYRYGTTQPSSWQTYDKLWGTAKG
ncbi:MAG TPA: glycosyl hydrolase family 18 protein [Ktedonobacterales bacterium]